MWNRIGTRLLPKLRSSTARELKVKVQFEMRANGREGDALLVDLRQVLDDLHLANRVNIDVE